MTNEVSPLLLAMLGAHVVVTVAGNRRYEGILVGATGHPEVSLAIRNARSLDTPAAAPTPTLLVLARDLLQLDALDVNLRPPPLEKSATFKTDTDITGAPPTTRGKPLEAWSGDDYVLGNDSLESGNKGPTSNQNWDQFATNERLYGVRTDYNEHAYTTKLDRSGSDYRAREQKAAQLEREILRGTPDYSKLAGNAHMAEERGIVDDSGLDEEDRYGAVIRGVEAYVPPGARKTPLIRLAGPPNPSATPSPPSSRAPSRDSKATPITNGVPRIDSPVVNNFRKFVSDEKERLSQKKQGIIKMAERKDKDSRIASLVEFSQNFKLKAPIPADLAEILGKDSVKKLEAKVAAAKAAPVAKPRISAASSSLIAEIPPFNPSRNKAKLVESVPVVVAPAKTPVVESIAPSKKISATAPAFVFRPGASSFTPSVSSAVSSPASKSAALPPANPFFGNAPIKKGSPSMHVKEDFTPFKSGVVPEPSSIVPSFPFLGRPYRAAYPGSPTPPPPPPEDDAGLPIHLPPPPPPMPQGYPMYPPQYPPNFRFQQPPPQHQQLQHLPPQQQNPQFHYPPPMQFPQQGLHAGPGPGFNPIQQGMRFGQFPPPPPNGPPLNFVDGGRPMGS